MRASRVYSLLTLLILIGVAVSISSLLLRKTGPSPRSSLEETTLFIENDKEPRLWEPSLDTTIFFEKDTIEKSRFGAVFSRDESTQQTKRLFSLDGIYGRDLSILYGDTLIIYGEYYGQDFMYNLFDRFSLARKNEMLFSRWDDYVLEYRIAEQDHVYQIVLDNYGGQRRTYQVERDPFLWFLPVPVAISDSNLRVHVRDIGRVSETILTSNPQELRHPLSNIYADQRDHEVFFQTSKDAAWPYGSEQVPLVLQATDKGKVGMLFEEPFPLGFFYKFKNSEYGQEIANGLLVFDLSTKKVSYIEDAQEIRERTEGASYRVPSFWGIQNPMVQE